MPSVNWLASYMGFEYMWIRLMVASYLRDERLTSLKSIDDVIPEHSMLLGNGKMMPSAAPSGQAVIQTHFLPQADVMRRYRELTRKVVYVAQDPRNIIVNAMDAMKVPDAKRMGFVKSAIGYRGFAPGLLGPVSPAEDAHGFGCGTWQQNVREWTTSASLRRYFPDAEVLTVKYEDIRDDPGSGLRRIVEFLGLASEGEGRIERAVANGSMENVHAAYRAVGTHDVLALRDRRPDSSSGDQAAPVEQSWSGLGAEAEAAYQQWRQEDDGFRSCLQQLGYR